MQANGSRPTFSLSPQSSNDDDSRNGVTPPTQSAEEDCFSATYSDDNGYDNDVVPSHESGEDEAIAQQHQFFCPGDIAEVG